MRSYARKCRLLSIERLNDVTDYMTSYEDCTEFIQSVYLYLLFPATVNCFFFKEPFSMLKIILKVKYFLGFINQNKNKLDFNLMTDVP